MRPRRSRVPSSCTRCMPIRSRAMASVLRSKKARGGLRDGLARGFTARDSKGIHYNGPAGGQGSVLYRNINWLQSFRGKRMSARGTPLPALFLSWLALGAGAAQASVVQLPTDGSTVVGEDSSVTSVYEDTLPDLAHRYSLGYYEIIRANPGV